MIVFCEGHAEMDWSERTTWRQTERTRASKRAVPGRMRIHKMPGTYGLAHAS